MATLINKFDKGENIQPKMEVISFLICSFFYFNLIIYIFFYFIATEITKRP